MHRGDVHHHLRAAMSERRRVVGDARHRAAEHAELGPRHLGRGGLEVVEDRFRRPGGQAIDEHIGPCVDCRPRALRSLVHLRIADSVGSPDTTGFLLKRGKLTRIEVPGSIETQALGINNMRMRNSSHGAEVLSSPGIHADLAAPAALAMADEYRPGARLEPPLRGWTPRCPRGQRGVSLLRTSG
jgi:hypothetical protein